MPSTITHAYFGIDVYNKLNNKSKKNLLPYIEQLKTFAQGPDVLYFYNSINFFKGKNIKNLGHYMHSHNTKDFFVNIISFIKKNHLEEDYEVISYLYGTICHYVLDYTTHPFIFYKTGIVNKKKKETFKYAGLHNDMESYIDAYYIYIKEKIKPRNFKVHKYALNTYKFSSSLSNVINYTFSKTYNYDKASLFYLKSIKQMRIVYYLMRYDPLGIKKIIYKIFNIFIRNPKFKNMSISYNIDPLNKINYLNLNKNYWNNPTNKDIISNDSFIELYDKAIKTALSIIINVNKVIYNNADIKTLDDIFLNLSYRNGMDCSLNLRMKYFEK